MSFSAKQCTCLDLNATKIINATSNNHGLVKCVRSHGIQTEASQPAGLHLASGTQSSRMKSRRVVSPSKMAPKR